MGIIPTQLCFFLFCVDVRLRCYHKVCSVTVSNAVWSMVQVVISHLKQQLTDSETDRERLAAVTVTKVALEEQIKRLTDELCDAKKIHTPVCPSFTHRYMLLNLGVPRQQSHRRSGLANLPSMGAVRPLITPYYCRLGDLLCLFV